MNREASITVQHKNCLSTYLSDWVTMMRHVYINIKPELAQYYNLTKIPTTFESLQSNTYDLSVMLSYLDVKLTILEETPFIAGQQIDYQAYSEARSFLKVCYLLIRILFDDVSGVIKYFYDKNEPNSGVTKSFSDLLNKAKSGKLPEDLSKLLEGAIVHFPEMRRRRVNLEHYYESLLVSLKKGEDGKTILGHFSTQERTPKEYGDIRQYFGNILCEYQMLIDNLLDHFDTKFGDWHGSTQGKSSRNLTIMQGCVALPLWWAYKHGNYRHKDLQVNEYLRQKAVYNRHSKRGLKPLFFNKVNPPSPPLPKGETGRGKRV